MFVFVGVYTIFNTPICSKLGALFLFKVKTLRKDTTHLCLRLATQGFLEQLHAASAAALKAAVQSEASDVESLGFDEEASPEATGSLVLDGWCLLRWMDFAQKKKKLAWVFFLGGDTVGLLIDVLFNDEWLFLGGRDLKIWEIRVKPGTPKLHSVVKEGTVPNQPRSEWMIESWLVFLSCFFGFRRLTKPLCGWRWGTWSTA